MNRQKRTLLILTLRLCEDLVFCGEVPLEIRVFGCKTNEVLGVRLKARDHQGIYKCKHFHHITHLNLQSHQHINYTSLSDLFTCGFDNDLTPGVFRQFLPLKDVLGNGGPSILH